MMVNCFERAVLRSAGCCCRGQCSLVSLERFLSWQGCVAGMTEMPDIYYAGMHWPASKASRVGQPWYVHNGKRVRFCFLEFRGDLDEYSGGMGMPYTNQHRFCMCCPQVKTEMHSLQMPLPYTHETYMAEISKCRICIKIDRATAIVLFDILAQDKVRHGRTLSKKIRIFDLESQTFVEMLKNDRLELDGDIQDVMCSLGELRSWPMQIVFWRSSADNNFHAWSWFLRMPGARYEHLMGDTLHTADLGPTSRLIGTVFKKALTCGEFGNSNTVEGRKAGCRYITKDLKQWYAQQPNKRKLSKLFRITAGMIHKNGHLKCKGGEARGALGFAKELLQRNKVRTALGNSHKPLLRAVTSMMKVYDLMAESDRDIDCDRLGTLLRRVAKGARKGKVKLIPKFHMLRHLETHARRAGNPRFYSTNLDESKNAAVVQLAQACHTADFSENVLAREALQVRLE